MYIHYGQYQNIRAFSGNTNNTIQTFSILVFITGTQYEISKNNRLFVTGVRKNKIYDKYIVRSCELLNLQLVLGFLFQLISIDFMSALVNKMILRIMSTKYRLQKRTVFKNILHHVCKESFIDRSGNGVWRITNIKEKK